LTLGAGQGGVYLLPFAVQQRDMGPFAAALLLVPYIVGSVIAAPLAGRLGDRFGTRPVIVFLLAVGALALLALVWGAGSSLLLVVCFVLIGASVNGALPLLAVRVIELGATEVGVGTLIAGVRMGMSSGTFIGPPLAGVTFARAGLDGGWIALAGCLVASLVLSRVDTSPNKAYNEC
jgi:MFS family permease